MTPADGRRPGAPPAGLQTALKMESGIWRSLFHWARRRTIGVVPGDDAFGYAAAAAPVLWVFIGLSAFEIPLLHFVLPWPAARVVFLLLGAWGLVWMVGLLASFYVHPHVVSNAGLRVRNSVLVDIPIPWDAVEAVRPHRRTLAKARTVQFEEEAAGGVVHVSVSSMTNVEIQLAYAIDVPIPKFGRRPVMVVRCFADDPAGFIAIAQNRLAENG